MTARLAIGIALLTGACTTGEVLEPPALERDIVEAKVIPMLVERPVDVLLVIDNSPAMAAYLPRQEANLRAIAAVFAQTPDRRGGVEVPDLHLAVITTDLGGPGSRFDDGAFQRERHVPDDFGEHVEPCAMLAAGATFIIDAPHPTIAGGRAGNHAGTLGDVLGCIGSVGARGATFAAPLEAARRALDRAKRDEGDARGFLRDEARLAVYIISASDDCSPPIGDDAPALWRADAALGARDTFRCAAYGLTCDQALPQAGEVGPDPAVELTDCVPSTEDDVVSAIEPHVDWLRSYKANPRDVVVSIAAGPTAPVLLGQGDGDASMLQSSCGEADAPRTATPAVRLDAFRRAFVDRNYAVSICSDEYESVLIGIAELLGGVIGNPCMSHPLADSNPALPGVQPDCAVAFTPEVYGDDPTAPSEVLPVCDADASVRPCWRFVANENCDNDAAGNLAFEFEWPADRPRLGLVRTQCAIVDEAAP